MNIVDLLLWWNVVLTTAWGLTALRCSARFGWLTIDQAKLWGEVRGASTTLTNFEANGGRLDTLEHRLKDVETAAESVRTSHAGLVRELVEWKRATNDELNAQRQVVDDLQTRVNGYGARIYDAGTFEAKLEQFGARLDDLAAAHGEIASQSENLAIESRQLRAGYNLLTSRLDGISKAVETLCKPKDAKPAPAKPRAATLAKGKAKR